MPCPNLNRGSDCGLFDNQYGARSQKMKTIFKKLVREAAGQSAIRNPQSAIEESTIRNPQSAMGAPRFLAPEVLARITSLELLARTVVEGFISGLHRSPFTGFSTEFAEHRQYMPGDDLRYLDWKLLGRTDRYYIKKYRADTNSQCHILIDASASMRYTTTGVTKLQYA